jgi:hypothetical protein
VFTSELVEPGAYQINEAEYDHESHPRAIRGTSRLTLARGTPFTRRAFGRP